MSPAAQMTMEERWCAIAGEISRHRAWYFLESLLFIALGFAAVALPGLTTLAVDGVVGAVSLLLGIFIFSGLPVTGMVFLATAIGVSMMFYGFSLLILASGAE